MLPRGPRYSPDEYVRRGLTAYAQYVVPKLGADDTGKFVAVEIETGEFEVDAHDWTATNRLLQRLPTAQPWMMRVGKPTAYRLGVGRPA
jgi:hypothetical protein